MTKTTTTASTKLTDNKNKSMKHQITWKMAQANKHWETKMLAGAAVMTIAVCAIGYVQSIL